MNYEYLLKHKELFQYAIGVTYSQFEQIFWKFVPVLREVEYKRAYSKIRVRQPGAGRRPALKTDRRKLFFVLLYYKTYPTFRFAQVLFGFDKRNVQLWVRFLAPVLFTALEQELVLPKRKIRSFGHWLTICPALSEFIADCTERQIQRPKDKDVQENYYSGKKKHHTVKNQLLVNPRNKKILAIGKTVAGRHHDKQIFTTESLFLQLPKGARGMGDSAYQGVSKEHPFLTMVVPRKKPPGGELTIEEKETNRNISSIRVQVEHPISYLKHFNILSQRFRSRPVYADLPIHTIAAIYNFTREKH